MEVSSIFLDDKDRPPRGTRVYIKSKHSLGTITGVDGGYSLRVQLDGESDEGSWGYKTADLLIIGPPEIMTLDDCPICEETIRVKVK